MTRLSIDLVQQLATSRSRVRGIASVPKRAVMRFAFYGRVSTVEFQDPGVSHDWQRMVAEELIGEDGVIVAEFFDVGYTRELAWPDRPRAAALLEALAGPDKSFDAIVFGEYERGFYGKQFLLMAPLFEQHGVQVWLPGFDGPVNYRDPQDNILLRQLAFSSQLEVQRSRLRATASMRAQACNEGRFLGGRPPYGYRLGDAGPHSTPIYARLGRRKHRLEPDPATAPTVRLIFRMRIAGHSFAHIARTLNESEIACPSRADRARNPHRHGKAWTVRTVATILANPRYTGHQVWNRQRTDRIAHPMGGNKFVRSHNRPDQWAISRRFAHPGLVSVEDFHAAQVACAMPTPKDGQRRDYLLTGLLCCGLCSRRLDAHWVNNRPGYRCRHGHTSARPLETDRPKNIYVREDHAIAQAVSLLADLGHGHLTPYSLAKHLREHEMMIVCGQGTFSVLSPNSTRTSIPSQRSRTA